MGGRLFVTSGLFEGSFLAGAESTFGAALALFRDGGVGFGATLVGGPTPFSLLVEAGLL